MTNSFLKNKQHSARHKAKKDRQSWRHSVDKKLRMMPGSNAKKRRSVIDGILASGVDPRIVSPSAAVSDGGAA
jgi:hypothetical protein